MKILIGVCIIGIGAWMGRSMNEWAKRDVRTNNYINGDGDE